MSDDEPAGTVTSLFADLERGDRRALEQIFPIVYEELRLLARRQRRNWNGDTTMGTTALVHEAYLKLVDADAASVVECRFFWRIVYRGDGRSPLHIAGHSKARLEPREGVAFPRDEASLTFLSQRCPGRFRRLVHGSTDGADDRPVCYIGRMSGDRPWPRWVKSIRELQRSRATA